MTTLSVLLVDDDKDIRETLAEVLEMEGYKVHTATNGLEALNFLQNCSEEDRPSLIILDLAMPVMTGHEFLDHVHMNYKDQFGDIPVIVASANLDTSPIVLQHAKVRLKKPVDLDHFLDMVKVHCGPALINN